jgi:methylenetetrahydrofolate reductase (NADPH)
VTAAHHDAIAAYLAGYSIEALPRELDAASEAWAALRPGTKIYLTRLPKASFADTLAAAGRLRARGFEPVPHLTARTTRNRAELREQLAALVAEAGVEEVLAISGSQSEPAGEFSSTMEMLETHLFERSGIKRVGVAGHPEGEPNIGEAELARALERKNGFARATGLAMYVVTQFFFEAEPVIRWERRIRELGNELPVRAGFHGLSGTAGLLRHAIACGIGDSIKVLTQHGGLLRLTAVHAPDRLVSEIAAAAAADSASLFAGAHFFPLGGFARTVSWANAVAAGRFRLEPDGTLRVDEPAPSAR